MLQSDKDYKERLIATVKKEVKQVMEESVTKKFVHEESGCVTSLCGAVEACLSQGLRRRALGLFKTSSTTALLHKIAKHCPEASSISKKVEDLENTDPTRRSSSSSDSVTKPTLKKNASLPSNPLPKYLWIRLALFEKHLAKIIDFLVSNAHKYYDKDALVADPEYGTILSSLLMGPCALDYSRMKNHDHFWTDPPADELVQRHRISSGHSTPPSVRRPILNFRRSLNTSSDDVITNRSSTQQIAKDYVETLHQNSKATLLFGKNNVLVLPVNSDLSKPIPGYLSLHQMASGLAIKWTPNQLMNGFVDEAQDKSIYWDYALNVRLDDIVYVHCHQDSETGGTVILVGQDGVQRPPIHFPKGGHMLAFLSCIETGLLPHGRLDPPLWSQRSGKNYTKRRRPLPALTENEDTSKDYVFRIVDNTCNHKDIRKAFYGWLAYCRHLSTVRTHLSGLVHTKIINGDGASEGITIEKWAELCLDGVVSDYAEVYRLTYFGGIAQDLRHEIWPYLLGHYKFGSTSEQRKELSEETRQAYENTMSEWLAVEAIVKQRDKENQAHAIAKLSSESMSGEQVPAQTQEELCNEVFEDDVITDDEDESLEEDKEGGKKKHKHTKQNTIKYMSDEEDSGGGKEVKEENKEVDAKEVNPTPADNTNVQNDEALSSENKISTYGSNVDKEDIVIVQDEVEADTEDSKESEQQSIVNVNEELKDFIHNVIVINASVDICNLGNESPRMSNLDAVTEENNSSLDTCIETHGLASPARSCCVSPASSNGGVYSQELLETFGLNLHRIEKDVQRCDRNYWYFMEKENLDKLRNVMCTWFLLDFKRELMYPDVNATWEVIWAAQQVASTHFVLFLALALLETYRDIILSNGMDFTDIIKFFNEMAERHNVQAVLKLARDLVLQLQILIENK
ncbi:unnamed protein product [Diabrotica balteata]|uniref:RUN domain-containing protein n=1 Tax=Diabrotica balteata TaxID=107213 RepID=A0A9N9T2I3_DIABA|nr:unnamed protein product [Diabrotica balteata]